MYFKNVEICEYRNNQSISGVMVHDDCFYFQGVEIEIQVNHELSLECGNVEVFYDAKPEYEHKIREVFKKEGKEVDEKELSLFLDSHIICIQNEINDYINNETYLNCFNYGPGFEVKSVNIEVNDSFLFDIETNSKHESFDITYRAQKTEGLYNAINDFVEELAYNYISIHEVMDNDDDLCESITEWYKYIDYLGAQLQKCQVNTLFRVITAFNENMTSNLRHDIIIRDYIKQGVESKSADDIYHNLVHLDNHYDINHIIAFYIPESMHEDLAKLENERGEIFGIYLADEAIQDYPDFLATKLRDNEIDIII